VVDGISVVRVIAGDVGNIEDAAESKQLSSLWFHANEEKRFLMGNFFLGDDMVQMPDLKKVLTNQELPEVTAP